MIVSGITEKHELTGILRDSMRGLENFDFFMNKIWKYGGSKK